jgi:peroxiredoxin
MPLTPSNPISIGADAPNFRLPEPLTGALVGLDDFPDAAAILVAFISNVCPAVKLIDEAFNQYAKDYAARGVQVIAINANAAEIKAGESAGDVADAARALGYLFPYLRDESQSVAQAYDAACTPDLFLYDGRRKLFYHGQFDDARPGNGRAVTGADLRAATEALLAGQPSPIGQKAAIGCNIKWRGGDAQGVRQTAGAGQSAA